MESHITPGRVRNPSSIAWMSWGSHVAMKSWDEHHLVGGAITILKKYEFVSWDDSSQYMEVTMTGWWLSPTPLKNDGGRQWEG